MNSAGKAAICSRLSLAGTGTDRCRASVSPAPTMPWVPVGQFDAFGSVMRVGIERPDLRYVCHGPSRTTVGGTTISRSCIAPTTRSTGDLGLGPG